MRLRKVVIHSRAVEQGLVSADRHGVSIEIMDAAENATGRRPCGFHAYTEPKGDFVWMLRYTDDAITLERQAARRARRQKLRSVRRTPQHNM